MPMNFPRNQHFFISVSGCSFFREKIQKEHEELVEKGAE